MPAESQRQQHAAGADLARCRVGKTPKTFGDCKVAEEFAHAPGGTTKGLPPRALRPHDSPPLTDAELGQGYRRVGKGLD